MNTIPRLLCGVALTTSLRQQTILDQLDKDGSVSVTDMVARFEVSEMTIRRDLAQLEKQGLLRRVYGGAVSQRGRSYEPPFILRTTENLDSKQRIGAAAAALIKNGDSISLDVGTTTLELAKNLHTKQNLTVITASLQIANELINHPGIRLIVTGGILRPGELSLIGHLSENAFREFYVDKLFLAAGAVDLQEGVTEFNLEDTLIKRAMIKNAKQIILIVDSSKFQQTAFASILPLQLIHTIITDNEIDDELAHQIRSLGIELITT